MFDLTEAAQKIAQITHSGNSFLIISHERPDADTIGAGSALRRFLEHNNKEVVTYCSDTLSDDLLFIPGSLTYTDDEAVLAKDYDAVFVVDSGGTPSRAGLSNDLREFDSQTPLIIIDHHSDNTRYGTLNLVLPELSSTCEILGTLFNLWSYTPDPITADCLVSGIVYDTKALINAATQSTTAHILGQLIAAGADLHKIINKTYNNFSAARLRLWGRALSRLQISPVFNIACTYMTEADFNELGLTADDATGFINYLIFTLKEADAALLLREEGNNQIKGSLRTISETFSVQKLAHLLGGGGHPKAAGFVLKGKITEADGHWYIA